MKPSRLRHSPRHSYSSPTAITKRTAIDPVAFAKAQQRDNTATRAYTAVQIKASNGKCWYIDINSGNAKANDTPVQLRPCDGSDPQKWDIITEGKHINDPGRMLVVNGFTNACLSYNAAVPNRVYQVHLFSCGGLAEGQGTYDPNQLMAYSGGAGPLRIANKNNPNSCLSIEGDWVRESPCSNSNSDQLFTFSKFSTNPGSGGSGNGNGNGSGDGGTGTSKVVKDTTVTKVATATETSTTDELRTVILSSNGTSVTVTVNKDSALKSVENSDIFNTVPTTGTSSAGPTASVVNNLGGIPSPGGLKTGSIAGIVVGVVAAFLLISFCVLRHKRARSRSVGHISPFSDLATFPVDGNSNNPPTTSLPHTQTTQPRPGLLSLLPLRPNVAQSPTVFGPDNAVNPFQSPTVFFPSGASSSSHNDSETTDESTRRIRLERQMEMIQQEINQLKNQAIDHRVSQYRQINNADNNGVGDTEQMEELRGQIKQMKEEISRLRAQPPPPAPPPPQPAPPMTPDWLGLDDTRSSWREQPPPEYYRNSGVSTSQIPSTSQVAPVPHYS